MPANDPWSRSILSASPSSSSETDDDAPTDNRSLPYNSLSRNADLARELDLGTRDDRAVFKQTPFTLAKMRGGKTNGSTRANESKTKGNIVPATSVNHKGKTEQVVEKQKAGPAEEREPSYKPKWQKNTGWYNAHNKPIPLGPPPKRSILSSLDEEDRTYQSKALGTKSKKAAKKPGEKGKKGTKADEEERPVFKRIRELIPFAFLSSGLIETNSTGLSCERRAD